MLASDVLDRVRDLTNDTTVTYRWSDTTLCRWLADAQRDILRRRPDVGLSASSGTAFTFAPTTDPTASTDTLTLGDEWRQALTDYVCFRAFSQDGQNQVEMTRAKDHLALYAAALG